VNASLDLYDIAFIGHMCFDEVVPYRGTPRIAPGSAVLCGALAAVQVGKKVAVITRMARRDEQILGSLRRNGVAVHVIPAAATTYMKVIHPSADVDDRQMVQQANAGTWRAFEELYAAGRIRAIGISNFHPRHMDELMKTAEVVPMVNQIRLCPGDTQDDVVAYCRARGILPEAYSPLGTGKIFAVDEMQQIAQKYGRTIAQVCVRWSLQMGFLPLPKSVTEARIRENADVFGFELSAGDVQVIAGLKGCCGYSANPDTTSF
jgi:diketogulonate reductase-like aldo/keto reductase